MTESVGAMLIIEEEYMCSFTLHCCSPSQLSAKNVCSFSITILCMLQMITTFWAFAQDFSSFVLQDDKSRIHFSDNIRSASFSKCSLNLHVVC